MIFIFYLFKYKYQMPITKYTGSNLKKLKKDDLITHIIELYQFIDLFDNDNKIKQLKEKITELKEYIRDLENDLYFDDPNDYDYTDEGYKITKTMTVNDIKKTFVEIDYEELKKLQKL